MEIINIETQPTAEKNVASLKARLSNFDFMGPLRGPCLWVEMLNPSGIPFDGAYVKIDGDDWQNWPCDLTEEQDYEYISNIILNRLGLDRKHKLIFTEYPTVGYFQTGSDYTFTFQTYSYPSGEIFYQWSKDGDIIPDATGNSYSIINAQDINTGIYKLTASNNEFSITGSIGLYESIITNQNI
jgi:hypothetical protein